MSIEAICENNKRPVSFSDTAAKQEGIIITKRCSGCAHPNHLNGRTFEKFEHVVEVGPPNGDLETTALVVQTCCCRCS